MRSAIRGQFPWLERRETGKRRRVTPDRPDLARLRRDAAGCTRCELHGPATQTVFGRGPASAWLVLVGEQPGDREDVEGAPKRACSRSPCSTCTVTADWLSSAVEKVCEALVGTVVFFSMILVNTPPRVSMPRLSG